ncbi:MAG TPA: hypothetical protein ENJ56_06165, partial [Anaerolineae bacterium]|nr:hypothetical protein [Anaerolineae bacterium]
MSSVIPHSPPMTTLWGILTDELINIYDVHHVCVAAGKTIASFINQTTIIFLRSPLEEKYNIWLCEPEQRTEQFRWQDKNKLLSPLLLSEDISSLPTDLFVDGPIYHLAATHITLAPFYSSWFGYAPSGAIAFTGGNLP